jgi:hypothetical protein
MHAFAIDPPTFATQQRMNPTISEPRMSANQPLDALEQCRFVMLCARLISLRISRVADHFARPTLRHIRQFATHLRHCPTSTRRAR